MQVRVGDLASVTADALVRPAGAHLEPATPQVARFEESCGVSFSSTELREALDPGSAIVTSGGQLPVELVIHAVVGSGTGAITEKILRRTIASALHRAEAWDMARVIMPPFPVPPEGLSATDVARVTIEAIADHALRGSCPTELTLVVETAEECRLYQSMISAVVRP